MSDQSKARRQGSKQVFLLSRLADFDPLDPNFDLGSGAILYALDDATDGEGAAFVFRQVHAAAKLTGAGAITPTGYVEGLELEWVDGTQLRLGVGRCRSDDDEEDMTLSAPVVFSQTDDGAPIADGNHYAVWLAGNPPQPYLSLSYTAPALTNPKRRVGTVRCENHGGGEGPGVPGLLRFYQRWNGSTRRYTYDEDVVAVLAGAAGVFTDVSLVQYVPPTACCSILQAGFQTGAGGAAGDKLWLRAKGALANGPLRLGPGIVISDFMYQQVELETDNAQLVQYKVDDAAHNLAELYVLGFMDEI